MRMLALAMPPLVLAAQGDGLPGWAQVTVAIGVALCLATRQIVPGWVYNEQRTRLEHEEEENRRLTQTLLDTQPKTIAALEASTRTVDETMAELRVLRRA